MDHATSSDITDLLEVYRDSLKHAYNVGKIDWPNPITMAFMEYLLKTNELYAFRLDPKIVAAARLSHQPDERIWTDAPPLALYLGKLATSEEVRGTDYFRRRMLPSIQEYAGANTPLRLDCLSDNERLKSHYHRLGFISLGNVTFFSEKQDIDLTVTRYERRP